MALHGHRDPRRGWNRQDVRVHVVGAAAPVACRRRGAQAGGLILEVKGDFCGQVRSILRRSEREADYVEIGLDSSVCYNPLQNELDPYAVAYAVATLLNNLFGRSKEPFWQQAYTDLLKLVIPLRRITEWLHDLLGGLTATSWTTRRSIETFGD